AGPHVGRHDERGAGSDQCGAQGADGGPHGSSEVDGGHIVVETEGGVNGGGVGLVEVGGADGREPEGIGPGIAGYRAQGKPRGLHPQGGGVLVVGGAAASPLAAPAPDEGGMLRSSEGRREGKEEGCSREGEL